MKMVRKIIIIAVISSLLIAETAAGSLDMHIRGEWKTASSFYRNPSKQIPKNSSGKTDLGKFRSGSSLTKLLVAGAIFGLSVFILNPGMARGETKKESTIEIIKRAAPWLNLLDINRGLMKEESEMAAIKMTREIQLRKEAELAQFSEGEISKYIKDTMETEQKIWQILLAVWEARAELPFSLDERLDLENLIKREPGLYSRIKQKIALGENPLPSLNRLQEYVEFGKIIIPEQEIGKGSLRLYKAGKPISIKSTETHGHRLYGYGSKGQLVYAEFKRLNPPRREKIIVRAEYIYMMGISRVERRYIDGELIEVTAYDTDGEIFGRRTTLGRTPKGRIVFQQFPGREEQSLNFLGETMANHLYYMELDSALKPESIEEIWSRNPTFSKSIYLDRRLLEKYKEYIPEDYRLDEIPAGMRFNVTMPDELPKPAPVPAATPLNDPTPTPRPLSESI